MTYPNDADGDALRRVAGAGSDMSKPMDIDFAVAAPDEDARECRDAQPREVVRERAH